MLQESNQQGSKAAPLSPDAEGEDAESPMPQPQISTTSFRRRGAVSAEPITEEDVATYVKKVSFLSPRLDYPRFVIFLSSNFESVLSGMHFSSILIYP